mmetsp:Transcript_99561/g.257465  ORF Transcript_99561/g.257465 Transcript_99561/m.257465 type:complete len:265 (-) Transcript_99561:145-939(-)
MVKPSNVAKGLAVAAGCTFTASPGLSFVAVGRQGVAPGPSVQQGLPLGQSPMPQQPSIATAAGVACGLLAAGCVSAAGTTRRRTTAAKASADFAGGLVGSEYHGWGEYKWDPLEISKKYPDHLPWYREAELKHGRVAMLAMLGLVVPDFVRIPGSDFEAADLDFVNAHNKLIYGPGQGPMWWLLVFCGVIESLRFKDLGLDFGKLTLENAGDLNFGKGFLPKTEEGVVQMKIKELKNGRLAMLAVSGCLTQGVVFNAHHFPFTG